MSIFSIIGAKGKRQRKGKKKAGQKDGEDEEEDEGIAAQDVRGKGKKGRKKKKGDEKAGEEEPYTDDEIWKQYGSDADLDVPYVPKVGMPPQCDNIASTHDRETSS